jgi:signal transduction histidine kinase
LMREAISNLIDNAIKFTPSGGRVRLETTIIDRRPVIRIYDNGAGIPPAERGKIFQRFYRAESGQGAPGHGLGLSIAKTIAVLHGFDLTVEDNAPGARFELSSRSSAPATASPAS